MSEEMPEKSYGEVYWDGFAEADPAYNGKVGFGELGLTIRTAVEAGAQAVADVALGKRGPAKVIVVTEVPLGDRAPVERRYAASQWDDSDYSRLRLMRRGHPVGSYQSGAWLSVREDGATTGDPFYHQGRKLAIAPEQDYAEFTGWWEAQGYRDGETLDFSDARHAFASGMRAARGLAAVSPAQQLAYDEDREADEIAAEDAAFTADAASLDSDFDDDGERDTARRMDALDEAARLEAGL